MPYAKSLCLIVIASLSANLQAATLQSDKQATPELVVDCRSARTFRIDVQQSFREAPTVTLPFGETIRAFLKSPNLREVNDDADITILVTAVGHALGANYGMAGFCYTGAEVSGSLRVTVRSGLYCEASFKRRVDPAIAINNRFACSSPSAAPFKYTFDVFITKLCNIALDLFGVPPLLSALKDKNENLRIGVVKSLGSTSDPTLLDALIATLDDESSVVKNVAAETLANMPDARASDALVKSLKSSPINVRSRAAQILFERRKDCCPVAPLLVAFDDRRGRANYEIDIFRSWVALALGRTNEPLALRRLVLALRNRSEPLRVRSSIAEALGSFQDPTAAEALIAIVDNATEHVSVRSSAVRSLRLTRDPRAVPVLIRIVMDRQSSVREEAAFSLSFFREARVVEALIRMISQKEFYISPGAIESLKKLTGQQLETPDAWQKWWQDNKNTFDQQKQ